MVVEYSYKTSKSLTLTVLAFQYIHHCYALRQLEFWPQILNDSTGNSNAYIFIRFKEVCKFLIEKKDSLKRS